MRARAPGRRQHIAAVALGASLALASQALAGPALAGPTTTAGPITTGPTTASPTTATTSAGGAEIHRPVSAQLRRLVRGDPTASIDGSGNILFRDPVSPSPTVPRFDANLAGVGSAARTLTPDALDRTFRLHSLPGSQHTILLDFDGSLVSGSVWNQPDIGLPAATYPGWSLDGSPGFNPTERLVIRRVWRRVAEDYAPFDVDVTTQDPGQAAIDRSGPDDPSYGTRVLVSSSNQAAHIVCPDACSGLAYFDVFDLAAEHDVYQPTWVFPRAVGNDTKDIAEVISHEVGHNFGLLHDGTTTEGYYDGHGAWAPIMGAGYDRPIVQWSRGDYPRANNQQDDLALIAAHGAPLRPDEAGDTIAAAGPLPPHRAYITSNADRDVYALGLCAGPVTLRARRAQLSPNLDIRLTLLDASGSVVDFANPPATMVTRDHASGLSASISTQLRPGAYFVSVEGVGHRDQVTNYDGYGSVGAYTLTQSGCVPAATGRRAPPPRR